MNEIEKKNLFLFGLKLERKGAYRAALIHWLQLRRQSPTNEKILIRLLACALRLKKYKFVHWYNQRYVLDGSDVNDDSKIADLLNINKTRLCSQYRSEGAIAFNAKQYDIALTKYEQLSALSPEHPWAHKYRDLCRGLSNNFYEDLQLRLPTVKNRVYVTGCGRSGTWLLTSMLRCLESVDILPGENPIGHFWSMGDNACTHIIKRQHDAWRYFSLLPTEIKVIHMVRHPYDVLLSSHLGRENHISLERIHEEHDAFFEHLASRPNTLTLRYEDLVSKTGTVQEKVMRFTGLKAKHAFDQFHRYVDLNQEVQNAMHGLRPVDASAVDKWKFSERTDDIIRAVKQSRSDIITRFMLYFNYDFMK